MKHMHCVALILGLLAHFLSVPCAVAQNDEDHVDLGVFADYFNLSRTSPHINFFGIGGRAGFNVSPHVQIEAEMSYDFERNFTTTFSNGLSTRFVQVKTRPLHALFGPKFQTSGRFRVFGTFKVGLVNFSTTTQGPISGFEAALGSVTSGDTRPAIFPGAGVEGFAGPFGLRVDVGDDIYFDNGARNNLKITFGPTFRF